MKEYARSGITNADQLRALGADAAYLQLMQSGVAPHFIGYYALVMGLQGRPWTDCQGQEKIDLRARFDALKAQAEKNPSHEKGRLELEAALQQIGVISRKA